MIDEGVVNFGVSFNKGFTVVNVVSHLVLQVHLSSTGKEKLYHISMTTATGHHEGITAILRNGMRQNSKYHVINMEKGNNGEVYTFKVVII